MKYLIISVIVTFTAVFAQNQVKITYKELLAAKELYEKGSYDQASSIIEALKNDKDKKLAEQAWYLKMTFLNEYFVPVRFVTEPATSIVSHYISRHGESFKKFKAKYKKSVFSPEIERSMNEKAKAFSSSMEEWKKHIAVSLKDSCVIEHRSDSTFTAEFKVSLSGSEEDIFRVTYTGKLKRYEPWGDMQDEWGSTGLLLDANGDIRFSLDGKELTKLALPIEIKQYPEYVLRRVTEFGFSQEKTFIREDDSAQSCAMGMFISDNIAVPVIDFKVVMGKMHELVPYYSDAVDVGYPKGFRSKAYIDLLLYVK